MSSNKKQVQDTRGTTYTLVSELSSGGQGVVYRTDHQNALIKGFTSKDEVQRKKWRAHIEWLVRQDLAGLKLARPQVLLQEPRAGYVMELMDGLVSLESLLLSFQESGEKERDYLQQGGLRRRLRILCQLARTLNQLHARGMLYGDLSPANIFVSDDPAHAETWLIDCDNISLIAHSGLTLHTPDYGAPEVVRGDALLSSLTDSWSFAVIAYQLLTHNHPLKGDLVNEGEPEVEEEAALRGEHPWINDPENEDNACSSDLPIQLLEHSRLPELFQRCFGEGKDQPLARPAMAEWLEALTEVDEHLFQCSGCGGHSMLPLQWSLDDTCCFFCAAPVDPQLVLFEEFIYLPAEVQADQHPKLAENWLPTGRRVCLQPGMDQELKRLMPSFQYDDWPADHLRVEYTEAGLGIHPLPKGQLHLQRGETTKPLERYQGLKNALRGQYDEPYQLHIGDLNDSHVIWQFRW